MKLYLNDDLSIGKLTEVINFYSTLDVQDEDYLRCGVLDKRHVIEDAIEELQDDPFIYVYDYGSLQLTLSEFGSLYRTFEEKGIAFVFFKEEPGFLETLLDIVTTEKVVISKRVTQAMEKARRQGKTIGRPKVNEKQQNQIIFLYKQKQMSMRQISETCKLSLGTVHKYITEANAKPRPPEHHVSI